MTRVRRLPIPDRYDFGRTLGALAVIHGDPTVAFVGRGAFVATRTPDGPGTLGLERDGDCLVATAFGPGAAWLLEQADAIAGLRDDVTGFAELSGRHPLVRELAHRHRGIRMAMTGRVFHHLVPAIIYQKVTGVEASRGYRKVLRHFADQPAPGPHPGVQLPADPDAVAATPYWTFHPFGIEQKRADTLRRAAARAAWLEASADAAEATKRLMSLPGIGVWTAAEVTRVAYGDPDAVSVGDYHLKNVVAYALAGEPRATDERMLELLAPFAGQRARVCTLLGAAGIAAPRYGPRKPLRSFAKY
jgi:3-methyladenine DNA glycosylase/8-oxoguanine DNA glycosylase